MKTKKFSHQQHCCTAIAGRYISPNKQFGVIDTN